LISSQLQSIRPRNFGLECGPKAGVRCHAGGTVREILTALNHLAPARLSFAGHSGRKAQGWSRKASPVSASV